MKTLLRLRCGGCGYGVSVRTAPERCPMCSGTRWELEPWRPFSDFAADVLPAHLAERYEEQEPTLTHADV